MKLIWLSDIHLNFLNELDNKVILNHVVGKTAVGDCVVISGDIAEGPNVLEHMERWQKALENVGVDLKFVLGNHDYYRSSIADVRDAMRHCMPNNWLGNLGVVNLTESSALVGHDGWFDGLYGDYYKSRLDMNDYYLIKELSRLPPTMLIETTDRHAKIQELSMEGADHVYKHGLKALSSPGIDTLYIVTHVPPFVKAAWFKGKPSDGDWLPHFSSKLMGDAILKLGNNFPNKNIVVLCGHTHVGEKNNREYMETKNVKSITATAEYRYPRISKIFEVKK